MEKIYKIKAKVWIFPGDTPWHMVTLPKVTAKNIDFYFAHAKRGWGSLPVHVTLGKTNWKTSIFTDKKSDTLRTAVAESLVTMNSDTLERVRKGSTPKGNVLELARAAGVLAGC